MRETFGSNSPNYTTRIASPALRRVRALSIVGDRVVGMSNGEIAKKYNITEHTVIKEVKWAKQQGIIESAEERILNELVPLAITTYKERMQGADKDVFVAKDVLGMLSKLGERSDKRQLAKAEMGLEAWMEMRKERKGETAKETVIEAVPLNQHDGHPSPAAIQSAGSHQDVVSPRPADGFVAGTEYLSEDDE